MNNKTIDRDEMILSLEGAIEYLDKIVYKKEFITIPLEDEDYKIAFKEFENMIEGLDILNELLIIIKDIENIDYSKLIYENKSLIIYINEFNDFFSSKLIESMKNQDYQLVIDILNYEFEDELNKYKHVYIYLLNYLKDK